jgi:hypothetical protein
MALLSARCQVENVLLHNVERQLSPKKRIRHDREQSAVFIVHARHVIVVCRNTTSLNLCRHCAHLVVLRLMVETTCAFYVVGAPSVS